MLNKYYIKFVSFVLFSLLAVATNSVMAEGNFSARPSLSAEEHFSAAKEIEDTSKKMEETISTEAAMAAVYHAEQAIAKGYKDQKQARLLLQRMLWAWATSNDECSINDYKYLLDAVIKKKCALFFTANERANNMTSELYRDYSEDSEVVRSYYIYISGTGAGNDEKEVVLRKALKFSHDWKFISELAYVLLSEEKVGEAKERFAEALEQISNEFWLADKLEQYFKIVRNRGCLMPAETEQAVNAIPERYKTESGRHEYEEKIKAKIKLTKVELEDRKKLAEIKKLVINGIRQAHCKTPQ